MQHLFAHSKIDFVLTTVIDEGPLGLSLGYCGSSSDCGAPGRVGPLCPLTRKILGSGLLQPSLGVLESLV